MNLRTIVFLAGSLAWAGAASAQGWTGLGSSWTPAESPSVALDVDGHPYVACFSGIDGSNVRVRRWTGEQWQELPPLIDSTQTPAIRVDSTGHPVVACIECSTEGKSVVVSRWNGKDWTTMSGAPGADYVFSGGPGTFDGYYTLERIDCCSLALDGNVPVVAWITSRIEPGASPGALYVRRWNGSDWVGYGDPAAGGLIASSMGGLGEVSLEMGPGGKPGVAWREQVPETGWQHGIRFRRWTGTAWEELDKSASGNGISDQGKGPSAAPSLAIDSNGSPTVAWRQGPYAPDSFVTLRRWDPVALKWKIPDGTADGIISPPSSTVKSVRLAVGPDGKAWVTFVAWVNVSPAYYQAFLKRYDGQSWVEVQGSATGSTLTGGLAALDAPLALDVDGNCTVATGGSQDGSTRIDVRRLGPPLVLTTFPEPPEPTDRGGIPTGSGGGLHSAGCHGSIPSDPGLPWALLAVVAAARRVRLFRA